MQKAIRIAGIIVVVFIIGFAMINSMVKPSAAESVWHIGTTLGNKDAKNHFIMYSDMTCPYCIQFETILVENEEQFLKYLEENDILFEFRISDFRYEYGQGNPIGSRYSAIATYCARNEGKFWDYQKLAVSAIQNDFSMAANKSFWINLGKSIGLGDSFVSCIENEEPLAEITEAAAKTAKISEGGIPYFKFNKYTRPGFVKNGTWSDILMFFKAGLDS